MIALLALSLGASPVARASAARVGARGASAMSATPPPASPSEQGAALRRTMLRDVGGLALGAALGASGAAAPPAVAAAGGYRASSQGSQVNKDPESLLRLGLPIDCPAARAVQQQLEELKGNAQKSLWSKAVANAQSAANVFASKKGALASAVAAQNKAASEPLLASIAQRLAALQAVVETAKLDAVVDAQHDAVTALGELEELMIPKFPFEVPAEFAGLPRLLGRACVEVVVKRGPGAEEPTFNVDGVLIDRVVVTLVVDGFNAPLTAGNFVELCGKGFYDGMQVQRADGFVVQTGDPRGIEAADESKPVGYVKDGKLRNVPLELFPVGAKAPVYGATFDEEGYGGAAATLPFQAYGALGMAREEYAADSASSQWFFLLFDSDLTPAGKNLLDGRYACFGYTVKNAESLRALKVGDVIVSTKVLSGTDKLVLG